MAPNVPLAALTTGMLGSAFKGSSLTVEDDAFRCVSAGGLSAAELLELRLRHVAIFMQLRRQAPA
jgi:hypothetical protein